MIAAAGSSARGLAVAAGALAAAAALAACAEPPPPERPSGGLVLVRQTGATTDIHRVRIADGASRPLIETPLADEAWPYWSQAAGRIVYQSQHLGAGHGQRLRLLDPRDGRDTPLTREPAWNEHWPVWSPDGTKVAYVWNGRRNGRPIAGLAVASVGDGERVDLARTDRADGFYRPEFAPDGRRIVAQRHQPGGSGSLLYILEPGAPPRPLTGESDRFEQKGRFTRDGAWIVYTRRAARHAPGDVVLVRPDGRDAHAVASTPGSDDHTALPSPTRDEIAFVSDRDGERDLFLADLEGRDVRNLTRDLGRLESAPRWSPDGERVAVTVLSEAQERASGRRVNVAGYGVLVVDRAGRVLLDTPGAMPDWMPPF